MLSELLLMSKNDIPFLAAQVNIHQPTIKEIGYIGEENFFAGCELLNFSKDLLTEEDKNNLEGLTNFEVLMSIMNDKSLNSQKSRACALMVLTLLFPTYEIIVTRTEIILRKLEEPDHSLNKNNFENFKEILVQMFCLKRNAGAEFNPSGDMARKIAEKLKQGQRKRQELAADKNTKIDIFSRYISILSIGIPMDMNTLLNYSVYQLFDEFQRYELKLNSDIVFQARLAGAKDVKDVDNWMKDIHS